MTDTKRSNDLQAVTEIAVTDDLIMGRNGQFWRATFAKYLAFVIEQMGTGVGTTATSHTSLSLTNSANRTFTDVELDRAFTAGMRLRAADVANPTTKWMEGIVLSYAGAQLIIAMDAKLGTGTIADWTIGISGTPGVNGTMSGPVGAVTDNVTTFADTSGNIVKDSGIAVSSLAPKASPALTGTPTAPTAAPGTNTTQLSTTAFVKAAIDAVLNGVSASFDTLAEIATWIGTTGTAALKNTGTSGNTVPLLDGANTWSAVQGYGETALSYTSGGTTAWDASAAPNATVAAASGNSTMGAPSNVVAGRVYTFRYVQDSTPRTLAWNSAYHWVSGQSNVPTMPTGSGAVFRASFIGRASNVLEEISRGSGIA